MVWDCIEFIERLFILSKKFLKTGIHMNYSELLRSHDFTVRIVLRTSGSKALPDLFFIRFSSCSHGGSMHSTLPNMWLICLWRSSNKLWNFHRDSIIFFLQFRLNAFSVILLLWRKYALPSVQNFINLSLPYLLQPPEISLRFVEYLWLLHS